MLGSPLTCLFEEPADFSTDREQTQGITLTDPTIHNVSSIDSDTIHNTIDMHTSINNSYYS